MQASLEDIEREIWFRRRNADEITWTTKKRTVNVYKRNDHATFGERKEF